MVQYPSDSYSSASDSVYKIKKAPYMSPDHSSSARRKSDSDLKDIIKQKDDLQKMSCQGATFLLKRQNMEKRSYSISEQLYPLCILMI